MNPNNNKKTGTAPSIFDAFERIYIINLPSRPDRLRQVLSDLNSAHIFENDPKLRIFPGVRPNDAGGFPTIGTHGCFLSHLGVLREAYKDGLANVLLLEDDLALEAAARLPQPQLVEVLRAGNWDFAYPGHIEESGDPTALPTWTTTEKPLVCAHFLAFNGRALPALVGYLEDCLTRPVGDPDGGPMHVDGAYSMFRQRNPDLVTLLSMPSLGGQRSSRSDIHVNRWFDRMPVFREAASLARTAINYIRKR